MSVRRYAFTLIELMIVIVIIGVVYVLAIKSLHNYSDKSKNLTLQNLAEYMQNIHQHDTLKLVCVDGCKACFLLRDDKLEKEIEPFLDDSVRVYKYDVNLGANEIFFTPFFDKDNREFDICFEYEVSPEGVHSEMAVEMNEEVIAFASYFMKVQKFKNLEDFIDAKKEEEQKAFD